MTLDDPPTADRRDMPSLAANDAAAGALAAAAVREAARLAAAERSVAIDLSLHSGIMIHMNHHQFTATALRTTSVFVLACDIHL